MEDDLTMFALVGVVGVAVALLLVFLLTSRGAKARRRMAALGPQRDRAQSGARNVDPAKRRKAIAESLKEFETERRRRESRSSSESRRRA